MNLARKGWRVKCYTSETARRRRACLAAFVSIPIDHLWRHIQFLEERGAALLDLVQPHLNVFSAASAAFVRLCEGDVLRSPMSPLFYHFGPPGHSDHADLLIDVRRNVLQRAAHFWVRIEVALCGWPFRLCQAVDARCSAAQQQACCTDLFAEAKCCLDPHFSLKVPLPLLTCFQLSQCL